MRNLRLSSLCSILVLSALSTFGQSSSLWRTATDVSEGARGGMVGTVADVDDARNRLLLDPDDDRSARVTVTADSLTTQFNGCSNAKVIGMVQERRIVLLTADQLKYINPVTTADTSAEVLWKRLA